MAACVTASVSSATQVMLLVAVLPLLGLAIGTGTTAAYTIAGHSIPSEAKGVGFGVLSSASMAALALSPVLSGLLGSVSLRSVFLVNVALLAVLGVVGKRRFHQIVAIRNLKQVKS